MRYVRIATSYVRHRRLRTHGLTNYFFRGSLVDNVFPSAEHRVELLMRLKLLGVSKIEVGFSGGGDSGSITGVYGAAADGTRIGLGDINQPPMKWTKKSSSFDSHTQIWEKKIEVVDLSLEDILIDVANCALDESDLDWYNNDGGQGCLEIDLSQSPPQITLNVGINRMETTEYVFSLSDGDLREEVEEEEKEVDAPTPPTAADFAALENEDDDAPTSP